MHVVLWLVAGVLSAIFLVSGVMKLSPVVHAFIRMAVGWNSARLTWLDDVPTGLYATIGVLEVLAALGLIVPVLTTEILAVAGVLPEVLAFGAVLRSVAVVGLALVIIDAAAAGGFRWEPLMVDNVNVLLLVPTVVSILLAVAGIAHLLAPVAAAGLALLMVGAAITHGCRKEWRRVRGNLILLMLTAFVAWGRLGPYPFTVIS